MKYCLIHHSLTNHWPFVSLYSNEFQSIRHCVFGNSSSPLSKHPLSDFEKSKVRCGPCSCGIDTRWSNLVTRSCSWWMVYKPDDTSQHNFGRVCKWSIYREYFIEIAGVRYLRTSCWRIINRTSEHSERVRFLLQRQRVRKYRTRHFPCGIVFTPFPKSRASYFRFARYVLIMLSESLAQANYIHTETVIIISNLSKMLKFTASTHCKMTTKSKYQLY